MNVKTKIANIRDIVESIDLNEADEKLNIKVDDVVNDKSLEENGVKKDSKTWKIVKALGNALGKALVSYTADKSGDLIDELLLGQFKDSLLEIYKAEKLNSMSDDDAQKEYAELSNNIKFKQGQDRSNLKSRRDDNTSTEIDPSSVKFNALWYSNEKDNNVGKILSDLVAEIQKAAQDTEKEQADLAKKLKSMKIDVSDDDLKNFGPIISKAIANGDDAKTITANLKNLKNTVTESCNKKFKILQNKALLSESKFLLTEQLKNQIFIESLIESEQFQDIILDSLISEGFLSNIASKFKGKSKQDAVTGSMSKKWTDKIKDFGVKTIKALTDKTFQGIVSLGGLSISVLTGGWGATLALKAIYAVERHGKVLANAFERQFTKFSNSKGVITQMDFGIKDQKDSKYSARFYAKDMVWRVLNVKDQLKHPGKDYAKAILESDIGKKYRDRLAEIWNPLFDSTKGGKIDFAQLFTAAKNVKISKNAIKAFQDFAEQYDKIKANCIDSPKIDTRAQTLKKDKLDK